MIIKIQSIYFATNRPYLGIGNKSIANLKSSIVNYLYLYTRFYIA